MRVKKNPLPPINLKVSGYAPLMDDNELRKAYMKIFMKYAAQHVTMLHPESLPIFGGPPVQSMAQKNKKRRGNKALSEAEEGICSVVTRALEKTEQP